uniref:E2F transcription factor 6 n=1 Tax=Anas zonorhyncha TaxID=75864 RepID=A0A8B9UVS3_9AVES
MEGGGHKMAAPAQWESLRPLQPDTLRPPMLNLNLDGDVQVVRKTLKAKRPRFDASLVYLTRKFMDLVKRAPDGVLDLNEVATTLGVRKRRVYDITNVLDGIHLIQKRSKNLIQWSKVVSGTGLDQPVRLSCLLR